MPKEPKAPKFDILARGHLEVGLRKHPDAGRHVARIDDIGRMRMRSVLNASRRHAGPHRSPHCLRDGLARPAALGAFLLYDLLCDQSMRPRDRALGHSGRWSRADAARTHDRRALDLGGWRSPSASGCAR